MKKTVKKSNNSVNSGILTMLIMSVFTIVVLVLTILYLVLK